jgi:hypothetical protein
LEKLITNNLAHAWDRECEERLQRGVAITECHQRNLPRSIASTKIDNFLAIQLTNDLLKTDAARALLGTDSAFSELDRDSLWPIWDAYWKVRELYVGHRVGDKQPANARMLLHLQYESRLEKLEESGAESGPILLLKSFDGLDLLVEHLCKYPGSKKIGPLYEQLAQQTENSGDWASMTPAAIQKANNRYRSKHGIDLLKENVRVAEARIQNVPRLKARLEKAREKLKRQNLVQRKIKNR